MNVYQIFQEYIDQEIRKKSGKPFKNGKKVNKVIGIIINTHTYKDNDKVYAFVLEDNSIIDCHQCCTDNVKFKKIIL